MRILLATDGSEHGNAVADEIVLRCCRQDTEIRVISVVEPPNMQASLPGDGMDTSLYVDPNVYQEMENIARERARKAVQTAAARLRECGKSALSIVTEVLEGSPKSVIVEDAEAFRADLIVVGSHGHGMLESLLLGSVSQAVSLHAKCSVLIVRNRKTGQETAH